MSDGPDTTPDGATEGGTTATVTREEAQDGPIVVSPSVYRRLTSGLPGFIVAMMSCMVIVGMVILLTPRRNQGAIPRVEYLGDLNAMQVVAPYTPQAPEGLSPQWYPTSSRLSGKTGGPVSWHLGYYTPQKQYAALEQSNEPAGGPGGYVDRMTSQGRADGTVQIAGVAWDRALRKDKDQRSLIRHLPGMTIVVTGTASYDELAVLAGSLKAHPKPTPSPSRS